MTTFIEFVGSLDALATFALCLFFALGVIVVITLVVEVLAMLLDILMGIRR